MMTAMIKYKYMTIFCVILFKSSQQFQQDLVPNTTKTCLSKIFSLFAEYNSLIIYNNIDNIHKVLTPNTTRIIFELNSDLSSLYFFSKMDLFVFSVTDLSDLRLIYETLYNYRIWNSRAKYILTFKDTVDFDEIFRLSWSYYVMNIIIIQEMNIYTYYPYLNSCGVNITSTYLTHCNKAKRETIFLEKVPRDLKGCPITTVAHRVRPMVMETSLNREIPVQVGFEVTIFHNIAKALNFTDISTRLVGEWWGDLLSNGTYTRGYGRIQRREIDISYGFGHAEYFTTYDFDATIPHHIDVNNFWVPIAGETPKWKKILRIFKKQLWFTIIATVFVNAILWRSISHGNEINQFKTLVQCLMNSLGILLQSYTAIPTHDSLRISCVVWCIMSLILYTAYTSKLISFLTVPDYEKQINSMVEIINSNDITIGLYPEDYLYFDESKPLDKKILETYIPCPDYYACIDMMAYEKNMSVFVHRTLMKYNTRNYTMSSGTFLVYEVREYEDIQILRFNMVKGFPLLDRINWVILNFLETGLIRKWISDIEIGFIPDKNEFVNVPLTLMHMKMGFFTLFIGLFVSTIVFVAEILISKMKRIHVNTI